MTRNEFIQRTAIKIFTGQSYDVAWTVRSAIDLAREIEKTAPFDAIDVEE